MHGVFYSLRFKFVIFLPFKAITKVFFQFLMFQNSESLKGLVVSDLRSESKGSLFESQYFLCAEVSSLQ